LQRTKNVAGVGGSFRDWRNLVEAHHTPASGIYFFNVNCEAKKASMIKYV